MHQLSLLDRAAKLATRAHQGQVRKDGAPYISHAIAVALILSRHQFDETVIAAGLVHDVIEDTSITADELRRELGSEVVDIVLAVSESPRLPWLEQKRQLLAKTQAGPSGAQAVATADKIHNLRDFLEDYQRLGSDLWKRWPDRTPEQKLERDRAFLAWIQQHWNHPLVKELEGLIDQEADIIDKEKKGAPSARY